MAKLEKTELPVMGFDYIFYCIGCRCYHGIRTTTLNNNTCVWGFNGDVDNPTITPSILVRHCCQEDKSDIICHSFITDGKIEYLGDCTHSYAGKTVDLLETNANLSDPWITATPYLRNRD